MQLQHHPVTFDWQGLASRIIVPDTTVTADAAADFLTDPANAGMKLLLLAMPQQSLL